MFEKFGWSIANDRVMNEEVRKRAGLERERVEQIREY